MPRTTRNSKKNTNKKRPRRLNNRDQAMVDAMHDLDIIDENVFVDCQEDRDEEFKVIRKAYHKACLKNHPDKGGDPAQFRRIYASFEILKDMMSKRKGKSWVFSDVLRSDGGGGGGDNDQDDEEEDKPFDAEKYYHDFDTAFGGEDGHVPAYEFYEEAAKETMPTYRVELAKSGRSKCQAKPNQYKKCNDEFHKGKAKDCTDMVDPKSVNVVELIDKGEIRVGWLNDQSGTYSRWHHLRCWRVPIKVWIGLPQSPDATFEQFTAALQMLDEDLLCGFGELHNPKHRRQFVEYIQNKDNWATARTKQQIALVEKTLGKGKGKITQSKKKKKKAVAKGKKTTTKNAKKAAAIKEEEEDEEEEEMDIEAVATTNKKDTDDEELDIKPATKPSNSKAVVASSSSNDDEPASSTAMVPRKIAFIMPKPGRNGASDSTVFEKKTFVITGIFPEVGGGAGLDLGKAKVKAMIESFGGRVTSAISGKTDVLIIGKEPGMSKVTKARERKKVKLATLHDLKIGLDEGVPALEDFDFYKREEPLKIQSFSMGYQYRNEQIGYNGYNGLALQASTKDLAIAQGFVEPDEYVDEVPGKKKARKAAPLKTGDGNNEQEGEAILALPAPSNENGEEGSKPPAKKKATKKAKAAPTKKRGRKARKSPLKDVASNAPSEDDEDDPSYDEEAEFDDASVTEKAPAKKKARGTRSRRTKKEEAN